MKRFIRYGVVPVGIFCILLLVTVILIPILINVQKYVPEIEKQVSMATGRAFSLGPDLGVSFFPWLSISFSDMKLGNPPGFASDEFIKVRSFEARIKVLPLLRKRIEISRFVIGGLSVNLEKNTSGQANWEFGGETESGKDSATSPPFSLSLLSEKLSFALLAVTDGQVKWHDGTQNVEHQVEDIMLLLNDFTPDRPLSLDCKATFDGKPVAVEGKIGPVLEKNYQGALPVDLVFSVVNKLRGQMRGTITPQDKNPNFDLSLHLFSFSPREFLSACDLPFPLPTKDSEAFRASDLEFSARGDTEKITIDKGIGHLDDSKLNFSLLAQNFKHPQVDFTLDLDRIDLDRYLQPSAPDGQAEGKKPGQEEAVGGCRTWRDVVLAGVIQVGALKMHGGTMTEVHLPLQGRDGIFNVAPITFNISGGQVEAALALDLPAVVPTMQATFEAQGLEAEALLHDYFGWDALRGTLSAELALQGSPETMSISGEATVFIRDGKLVGVDLTRTAGMDGTDNSPHGAVAADTPKEKPSTDFTVAKSVVTINNGLVQIREASLVAPGCNLQINGTADLARQQLNLQIESDLVATVLGKGGREEKVDHSSLYEISGTFTEPEINTRKVLASGGNTGGKNNLKHLVAEKLSSPLEDDVKNLVGKDLVDPAVVAQRFRLQPELLRRSEIKKKLTIGTGRVHISALREETTLR